jgi:nitrate reductase NapE
MKSSAESQDEEAAVPLRTRRGEIVAFAILAVVIWPFVAVGVVGGYGFLVWMYQIVFGPPGPPATIH